MIDEQTSDEGQPEAVDMAHDNSLVGYDFEGMTVRVLTLNDAPWFVAADVCRALDMDVLAGTYQWTTGLGADEKRLAKRGEHPEIFSGSRAPSVTLISESGLYKLVLRSTKPEARRFTDWVTRHVLPAIRKDGAYIMGEEKVATGEMDEDALILRAMEALQRKVARLSEEKAQLAADNAVMEPKAVLVDAHYAQIERRRLRDVARTLDGVNLQQVSADLTAAGYLYKRGSQYRVRAPHRGVLFTEKADPIKGFVTVYVTPAGAAAVAQLYEAGRLTMRKGAAKAA